MQCVYICIYKVCTDVDDIVTQRIMKMVHKDVELILPSIEEFC